MAVFSLLFGSECSHEIMSLRRTGPGSSLPHNDSHTVTPVTGTAELVEPIVSALQMHCYFWMLTGANKN